MTTIVRSAVLDDAGIVQQLILELGYAPPAQAFDAQFRRYLSRADAHVLVAASSDAPLLVGVLTTCLIPLLHHPGNLGRITALVVASGARGQGIGSALIESAERWFRAHDCQRIEVTSGDARADAHAFYRARGYQPVSQRFVKQMT